MIRKNVKRFPGDIMLKQWLLLIDDTFQYEIGKSNHQCAEPGIFLEERHHVVLHAGIPVGIFFGNKWRPGRLPGSLRKRVAHN